MHIIYKLQFRFPYVVNSQKGLYFIIYLYFFKNSTLATMASQEAYCHTEKKKNKLCNTCLVFEKSINNIISRTWNCSSSHIGLILLWKTLFDYLIFSSYSRIFLFTSVAGEHAVPLMENVYKVTAAHRHFNERDKPSYCSQPDNTSDVFFSGFKSHRQVIFV